MLGWLYSHTRSPRREKKVRVNSWPSAREHECASVNNNDNDNDNNNDNDNDNNDNDNDNDNDKIENLPVLGGMRGQLQSRVKNGTRTIRLHRRRKYETIPQLDRGWRAS